MRADWIEMRRLPFRSRELDLDAVWQNIILQLGEFQIEEGNTLDEQIAVNEKRAKLQQEIDKLEKLAQAEKQQKKFELVQKIQSLTMEKDVVK